MDIGKAFGRILASKRHDKGLTQQQLADLTGLHRTYISLVERGLRVPTLEVVFRLSEALDIAPSRLIREIE